MVESKLKNTDIGQIPEDWDLVNWNDVFDFKSTASYSRAEIKLSGDVGYIHYGDIHTKIKATLDVNKFVSGYISNRQLKTYITIKEGDLIMADASEDLSGVGKSFEVINTPKNPVISGLHTFLIREKKSGFLANGFKGYFYFNPLIKKQYDSLATGLKVYSLSKGSFQHIQIPLPSIYEQKAITEVLAETDFWISSLENLILKKRNLKQGAIQMMLTPKEDWETKKLGDVCEYRNGKALEKYFNNAGGLKVISIGNYSLDSKYVGNNIYISKDYKNQLKKFLVKKNELTMILNDKTSTGDIIGRCLFIEKNDEFIINQRSIILNLKESIESKFMYYHLNSDFIRTKIFKESKPGTQIYINTNDVLDLLVYYPKSIKEQNRIANLLSDMDSEIENLEKKLNKVKQLKQGIIEQLLTGKIRLVNTLQTS